MSPVHASSCLSRASLSFIGAAAIACCMMHASWPAAAASQHGPPSHCWASKLALKPRHVMQRGRGKRNHGHAKRRERGEPWRHPRTSVRRCKNKGQRGSFAGWRRLTGCVGVGSTAVRLQQPPRGALVATGQACLGHEFATTRGVSAVSRWRLRGSRGQTPTRRCGGTDGGSGRGSGSRLTRRAGSGGAPSPRREGF